MNIEFERISMTAPKWVLDEDKIIVNDKKVYFLRDMFEIKNVVPAPSLYPWISFICNGKQVTVYYGKDENSKKCGLMAYQYILQKSEELRKDLSNNEVSEKVKEAQITKQKADTKVGIIMAIILAVCMICWVWFGESGSKDNEWDKLNDEEQEWYQENYGNGQYDNINDAIDNYGK